MSKKLIALFILLFFVSAPCIPATKAKGELRKVEYIVTAERAAKHFRVPYQKALKISSIAYEKSFKHKVPAHIVVGIIAQESSFQEKGNAWGRSMKYPPKTKNPRKPHGVMQVAGKWHKEKFPGGRIKWTTTEENIDIGIQVYKEYLEIEKGNVMKALQRYNGNLSDKKFRYAKGVMRYAKDLGKGN